MSRKNPHLGSSLDDFLREEGILDEVEAIAIKRVIALELEEKMKKDGITKTEMAKRLETSRSQLDRVLDPNSEAITLNTLVKAAHVVGKRLRVSLEEDLEAA
jgi:antitoxin HicB